MLRFWAAALAIVVAVQISAQELPLNPSYPNPAMQSQGPASKKSPGQSHFSYRFPGNFVTEYGFFVA